MLGILAVAGFVILRLVLGYLALGLAFATVETEGVVWAAVAFVAAPVVATGWVAGCALVAVDTRLRRRRSTMMAGAAAVAVAALSSGLLWMGMSNSSLEASIQSPVFQHVATFAIASALIAAWVLARRTTRAALIAAPLGGALIIVSPPSQFGSYAFGNSVGHTVLVSIIAVAACWLAVLIDKKTVASRPTSATDRSCRRVTP